jgi:hypothetical protein
LISGSMMLFVNDVTMAVNAAPTTTATARSTTFPRRMKSLKPLSTRLVPSLLDSISAG